jgi:hypothetical protein
MALDFNEEGHFVSVPWNKWLDLVMCVIETTAFTRQRDLCALPGYLWLTNLIEW